MEKQEIQKYIGIVKEQQESLRVGEGFCNNCAWELGQIFVKTAREKYAPVSIRIDIDGVTVFYYLMKGTSLDNDWWMKKKLNGCMKTGESSFMNYLQITASGNEEAYPWVKDVGNFAAVGGCFPLRTDSGELKGYLMVSGLPHEKDHQLIIDSLSEFLEIPVPTVLDGDGEF